MCKNALRRAGGCIRATRYMTCDNLLPGGRRLYLGVFVLRSHVRLTLCNLGSFTVFLKVFVLIPNHG